MILKIVLQDKNENRDDLMNTLGNKIHDNLAGNQNYIDSDIVLNVDTTDQNGQPICLLNIEVDKCNDIEFVRKQAINAVNLYIDQFKGDM